MQVEQHAGMRTVRTSLGCPCYSVLHSIIYPTLSMDVFGPSGKGPRGMQTNLELLQQTRQLVLDVVPQLLGLRVPVSGHFN